MKLLLCLLSLGIASGNFESEYQELSHQTMNECKKEAGVDKHKFLLNPDRNKMKCFFACLNKKTGSMKNGKLLPEKGIVTALIFSDKPIPIVFTNDVQKDLFKCVKIANKETDECELIPTFSKCMISERGFITQTQKKFLQSLYTAIMDFRMNGTLHITKDT